MSEDDFRATLSPFRRILKRFHPEGIPWPGAPLYNRLSRSGIFQRHYAMLAEDIVKYCPAGNLLDIGTGPGWLLAKLHEQSPALTIRGLDVSAAMVAEGQRNMAAVGLGDAVEIVEGAANRLPFGDASFDAVVSSGSMHHWKEPVAGLNETYRVLKPGSTALIYDLVNDTPADVLRHAAREFGRFRIVFLRLHALEEPFYTCAHVEQLALDSLFRQGGYRYVGVFCCLTLKKN